MSKSYNARITVATVIILFFQWTFVACSKEENNVTNKAKEIVVTGHRGNNDIAEK